jgi:phenylacetate-CoA ligase
MGEKAKEALRVQFDKRLRLEFQGDRITSDSGVVTEELFSPDEAMPVEHRQHYYDQKIRETVRFAYKNAPAIKERMDRAGVKPSQIHTTKDLPRIPFISRDEIIELQKKNPPFGGLLAVPVDSLYKVLYSPGPMYVPVPSPEYARPVLKVFYAAGLRRGDNVISSFPSLFAAGGTIEDALVLGKMVGVLTGTGNTELQVNIMRDLRVKAYAGTPSFLMNIVKKASELGYDFRRDFKLRSAVVAAEPLLPEVRRTLEGDYGISLTNGLGIGYGAWLGFECRQAAGFHMLEETFVEIVDPETGKQLGPGEVGAMVITGFNNDAFPIIRYLTGDLSAYTAETCPCGRTSIRLQGIMGRIGDSIKVRALYLTPGQVKTVASRFPAITQYQVVVSRVGYRDDMAFNIELGDEAIDRERLCAELQTCFQDACRLSIDRINLVPRGTITVEHKIIVDERSWEVRR